MDLQFYNFGAKLNLVSKILTIKGSQNVNAQIIVFYKLKLIIKRYWLNLKSRKYFEINLKDLLLVKFKRFCKKKGGENKVLVYIHFKIKRLVFILTVNLVICV